MDIPIGLNYKPMFPAVQSMFRQMEQLRRERAKAEAEAQKTALEKAERSGIEFSKFSGSERSYIAGLEPAAQMIADDVFNTNSRVQQGLASPQELNMKIAYGNKFRAETKMISSQFDADVKNRWGTDDYNKEKIQGAWGVWKTDLNKTAQTGEVVSVMPENFDYPGFQTQIDTGLEFLNLPAMTQKFMTSLGSTKYTVDLPNGERETRWSLPKEFYADKLGSAGQLRLAAGPRDPVTGEIIINSDQAIVLLNRFRAMPGGAYEKAIQLMTAQIQLEKPEAERAKPGSEQWGQDMQRALSRILEQNGWITEKTEVEPTPESAKSKFDLTKWIGGTEATDAAAVEGAAIIHGLTRGEKSSVSFFKNNRYIQDVQFDSATNRLVITPVAAQKNDLLALLAAAGADNPVTAGADGKVYIDVDKDNIPALITQMNAIAKTSYKQAHVQLAYEREYGNEQRPAPAAPPKNMWWNPAGPDDYNPAARQEQELKQAPLANSAGITPVSGFVPATTTSPAKTIVAPSTLPAPPTGYAPPPPDVAAPIVNANGEVDEVPRVDLPSIKAKAAGGGDISMSNVSFKKGVNKDTLSTQAKRVVTDLGKNVTDAVVTDTARSDAANKKAKGVKDSYHKTGDAVDFRDTPEVTKFFTSAKGKKWADDHGYQIIDERNRSGYAPHWHIEPKEKGGATSANPVKATKSVTDLTKELSKKKLGVVSAKGSGEIGAPIDIQDTPQLTKFFTSEAGVKWAESNGYDIVDDRKNEKWHLEPSVKEAPADEPVEDEAPPANSRIKVKDGYFADLYTAPSKAAQLQLFKALPKGTPYKDTENGPIKYKQ